MNMSRSRTHEGLDNISEHETRLSELDLAHFGKAPNRELTNEGAPKKISITSDNKLNATCEESCSNHNDNAVDALFSQEDKGECNETVLGYKDPTDCAGHSDGENVLDSSIPNISPVEAELENAKTELQPELWSKKNKDYPMTESSNATR